MLSVTCKTAIKAVIYLASKSEAGHKAGVKEVAAVIDASEHTVGKLLQVLVKGNMINSNKGPNGGFFLSAKQKNQPVIKVVEAIDGKDVFKRCGLGLSKCGDSRPCPVHDEYKAIKNTFETLCKQNTVHDLCVSVEKGETFLQ